MFHSQFDRTLRRFVPSLAKASYNPVVKIAGDAISDALSLPFRQLSDLPPNHLRIRTGVGNRVFTNHIDFIEFGSRVWLNFLSRQYCTFASDVVELGCGCGRIAWPLKDDWFEGTYVGVDIDSEMVEYCRSTFPDGRFRFVIAPHNSATYSVKHSNGSRVAPKLIISDSNSKDLVYSVSLYSHLLESEISDYFMESFRILRNGGIMHLTFFCIEHVELGGRWTFAHRRGNAYIETEQYPEAAVAYHQAFLIDSGKKLGIRRGDGRTCARKRPKRLGCA